MHNHLSYLESCVIGLLQGVTELVPISSLGHSVLVPALVGGQWAKDLDVSRTESPYLAYIVGLHVATALALLLYFRHDWIRIIRGLFTSLRTRKIDSSEQRLGWLLVLGTIPVGIVGLTFEHALRTNLGKPLPAAIFLMLNGVVLLGGERLRRKATATSALSSAITNESHRKLDTLSLGEGMWVGSAQMGALAAGISRSGITMVAGLLRGLSHEDAARFSFLLATPVILAAGALKLKDLFGPLGDGIRGQVLAGSILAGLAAYGTVRFLSKYFETRTLTPFALYSLIAGGLCVIRFGFF